MFPPELNVDYGTPVDKFCKETSPGSGVFAREWSGATVQMDCKSFTGSIVRK